MPHLRTLFANRLANRRLQILSFLIIPCALFFFMRAQLSWRPRVIGKMRNGVTVIAWSPDGKWLAGASGDMMTWDAPSEIYVISLQGKGNKWIKVPKTLKTLQFTANGDELVGIDIAQKLYRWDWKKRRSLSVTVPKGALAISGDAKLVAVTARGGVAIHSVQSGQQVGFLKDPRSLPKVAAFSPDNKKLALFCAQSSHVGHSGNSLQIWKISFGDKPTSWTSGSSVEKTPFALQFWRDSKSIVMLGPESIWVSTLNGTDFIVGSAPILAYPSKHPFWPAPFAYEKEYTSSWNSHSHSIHLQRWPAPQIVRELKIEQLKSRFSGINVLAFSPDGATLASGDAIGSITLWRIK